MRNRLYRVTPFTRSMTNGSGALESGRAADAAQLMAPLHEADVAGLLEHLPAGELDILVDSLGAKLDAETYAHLDEAVREDIVETINNAVLADVVVEFGGDDAVDFMRALHPIDTKFLGR